MGSCSRRAGLGLLFAVLFVGSLPGVASAAPRKKVLLSASVSGSMLSINLKTAANSKCDVELGSGGNVSRLPATTIGDNGRGNLRWRMPSDIARGPQTLSANCSHRGHHRRGAMPVVVPAALATASATADSQVMAKVLNLLLDALLGGTLVLFVIALIQMVIHEEHAGERFLRTLALIAGAVVALGAQAAGVSFADYTIDALTGARPGGAFFKAASVIIPGGIAAGFGWYFIRVMRRSAAKGLRLISFLGMLTIVAFAEILARATSTQGVFLGAAAIPNASFVAGMILAVLVFAPDPDETVTERRGRLVALGDVLRRRSPKSPAFRPTMSNAPATAPPARTNPFVDD